MKVLSFDPGLCNLAYSITEKKGDDYEISDYGIINLLEKEKCEKCKNKGLYLSLDDIETHYCCKKHKEEFENPKKIKEKTSEDICKILISKLDFIFDDNDLNKIDIVLIENQPSFLNPQVKSIASMLLTYFAMKNKKVILRNPNMKVFNNKFENTKNKYTKTKKLCVDLCNILIKKETMSKILELYVKIDDICDTILMSVSYLNNNKPPEKIKDLIKC